MILDIVIIMKLESKDYGMNFYSAENLGDFNENKNWALSGKAGVVVSIKGRMFAQANTNPMKGGRCFLRLNDFNLVGIERKFGAYRIKDLGVFGILEQDEVKLESTIGWHTRFAGDVLVEQPLLDGSLRKSYLPFNTHFSPEMLYLLAGVEIENPVFFKQRYTDKFALSSFSTLDDTTLTPEQFDLFCARSLAQQVGFCQR